MRLALKWMTGLALVFVLLWSARPRAERNASPKPIQYKRVTTYDFPGETVDGDLLRPAREEGRMGSTHARKPGGARQRATVDNAMDTLDKGDVAFNVPQTLTVGKSHVIVVSLTFKGGQPEARALVLKEVPQDPVQSERVRVGDSMQANLRGEAFAIEALTPELQAVTREEPTLWKWSVTPKEPGLHTLHLTLNTTIEAAGRVLPRSLCSLSRAITIQTQPVGLLERAAPALALLALLGGLAWFRRRPRAPRLLPEKPQGHFDFFISYSSRNRLVAQQVVAILTEAGHTVWMDQGGIEGASRWAEEISTALRSSRAVVLLGSKDAFASPHVNREIALAVDEQKPFVPLVIEEAALPPALRYALAGLQLVRFTSPADAPGLLRAAARALTPPLAAEASSA
jgi:hypothetical protein